MTADTTRAGLSENQNWCKNLRVAGETVVRRGENRREVWASEIRDPEQKAALLKGILAQSLASRIGSGILRMGYDLTKDSTMEDCAREAMHHPAFEVRFKPQDG